MVDNFFKVQTRSNLLQVAQINKLLKIFKKRLLRYSKARQKIKLNKVKNLIESPLKPIEPEKLIKSTPDQTRKAIKQASEKLLEERDFTGIIDQQIALERAVELSLRDSNSIPENLGVMGSQLQRLTRTTSRDSEDKIESLQNYKQDLESEFFKLQNSEKLLFSGIEVSENSQQTLSLAKILDLLIFLSDRKLSKYNCQQCKFYKQGQGNNIKACVFAGQGAQANTSLVNFIDSQTNQQIVGRLTEPTNSCQQVWGLDTNDYYQFAPSIVERLRELISKK